MARILIVEDSETIRAELSTFLTRNGHTTQAPEEFDGIVDIILESVPDLVLLDINLPDHDGFHVTREIRKRSDVPIIIVTSRDTEIDELTGMNLGADDFITKPYNTQILLARISSVLRRGEGTSAGDVLQCGRFDLNLSRSTIVAGEHEVELTRNELRILSELSARPGTIVSREHLMRALWDDESFVDDNTLTVNINRLRTKLDSIGLAGTIETRRGQGYLIGE